ncbi:MAG: hypothetical protein WD266_10815 [Balneolales bacterium]
MNSNRTFDKICLACKDAAATRKGFINGMLKELRDSSDKTVYRSLNKNNKNEQNRIIHPKSTSMGEPAVIQNNWYGCGFADPDGHKWNVFYNGK